MKTLSSAATLSLCAVALLGMGSAPLPPHTKIAIAIGLNRVDPARYAGWEGPLEGCEKDASAMLKIAKEQGYETVSLKTKAATRRGVRDAINGAAQKLHSGDTLVLSYSGHGSQSKDTNGDERDGLDETWCLYDGQIVDDELALLWSKFREGVRIVVYSDSCHSGSVIKKFEEEAEETKPAVPLERFRIVPSKVAEKLWQLPDHKDLDKTFPSEQDSRGDTKASVLLVSGCQDNQLSRDGDENGLFTAHLIKTWNNAGFQGSYRQFHEAIRAGMPSDQQPNLDTTGRPNPTFEAERPWTPIK